MYLPVDSRTRGRKNDNQFSTIVCETLFCTLLLVPAAMGCVIYLDSLNLYGYPGDSGLLYIWIIVLIGVLMCAGLAMIGLWAQGFSRVEAGGSPQSVVTLVCILFSVAAAGFCFFVALYWRLAPLEFNFADTTATTVGVILLGVAWGCTICGCLAAVYSL